MKYSVAPEPWDTDDGARLRGMQRAELDARYGSNDHEPGSAPTAEDISLFVVAREVQGTAGPGKINYATPGVGTVGHFAIEHFAAVAGIKMTMVPYKGAALYVVDLMSGNIDYAQVQIFQARPYVRDGKMRALGVTGTARSPLLPEVRTAAEQGLKGFSSYNWNGILAPAGTPKDIVNRIHAVLGKPLKDAATRQQLENVGYEVSGDGPVEFAAFMKAETEKWADVARKAGIPKI